MRKEQEAGARAIGVCRKHGICLATFYEFNTKPNRQLKAIEDESARLEKLVGAQMLDNAIREDVSSKNGDARRKAIALACAGHGVSERRAWQMRFAARSPHCERAP